MVTDEMLDQYEERAGTLHADGLTVFEAEIEAARRLGVTREAIYAEIARRNSGRGGDPRKQTGRHCADDMPKVQPAPHQEQRSLLIGDVQ